MQEGRAYAFLYGHEDLSGPTEELRASDDVSGVTVFSFGIALFEVFAEGFDVPEEGVVISLSKVYLSEGVGDSERLQEGFEVLCEEQGKYAGVAYGDIYIKAGFGGIGCHWDGGKSFFRGCYVCTVCIFQRTMYKVMTSSRNREDTKCYS